MCYVINRVRSYKPVFLAVGYRISDFSNSLQQAGLVLIYTGIIYTGMSYTGIIYTEISYTEISRRRSQFTID